MHSVDRIAQKNVVLGILTGIGMPVACGAVGYGLGTFAAVGHGAALAISTAILPLALVIAYKSLEGLALLLAPFMLVRGIFRWLRGYRPPPEAVAAADRRFSMAFIPVFAFVAALGGGIVGAYSGGWSVLSAFLLYGLVGVICGAVLRPLVMWCYVGIEP